uniref:3-beta hydroxysteroid dehydrogenase/isomerase domain-containing protein n=1 Tax=Amazona collaria TaxID=241587 RepID=A0A8B9GEE9_9PSIT
MTLSLPVPCTFISLVTEGCGFIGEKIVQLLSQQDYIKEVRGFDSVAREEVQKFTTASGKSLESRDCRINHSVTTVSKPCAPLYGHSPCLTVYCRGNEDTKYSGEVELPYGKTKAKAEKLVFETNGKKAQKPMVAPLVLQPRMDGRRRWVERPHNSHQCVFNHWNVAWIHVLAARNLQLKPDLLMGQVYYAYADTPTRKGFLIRHQLLSSVDPSVRLGSHIPYCKMWLMIQVHRITKVILYPFWKPQPFLNLPLLNMIVTTFSYETDKASRRFGYKPLFTWEESKHRTAQQLKAAVGNLEPPQLHDKNNQTAGLG